MEARNQNDESGLPVSVRDYECIVRPSPEEGGGWLCVYPELPGCFVWGPTRSEAFERGEKVAQRWLERAPGAGIQIPAPRAAHEANGMLKIRVPKSIHKRLANLASERGLTLNALTHQLINSHFRSRLANDVNEQLEDGPTQVVALAHLRKYSRNLGFQSSCGGTWMQRLPPGTHYLLQRLADSENVSTNQLISSILTEQATVLEIQDLLGSESRQTKASAR